MWMGEKRLPVATGHCENNLFIAGVGFEEVNRARSTPVNRRKGTEQIFEFFFIHFNVWYFV